MTEINKKNGWDPTRFKEKTNEIKKMKKTLNIENDNFDIGVPNLSWSYILDYQTIEKKYLSKIGVGVAFK